MIYIKFKDRFLLQSEGCGFKLFVMIRESQTLDYKHFTNLRFINKVLNLLNVHNA